jgi:TPR repeat protein
MSKRGLELFNKGEFDESFKKLTLYIKNTKKVTSKGYYDAHKTIDNILENHQLSKDTIKWLKKNEKAKDVMAKVYYFGSGVKRDYTITVKYLRESETHMGLYLLGNMLSNGSGCSSNEVSDKNEVLELFKKSAEMRNMYAQCTIGDSQRETNITKAIEYYKYSSDQGYGVAQYILGTIYEKDDPKESLKYYRLCNNQEKIGDCLEKIDNVQAIEHYETMLKKKDNLSVCKKLRDLYDKEICKRGKSGYKRKAIKLYRKIGYKGDVGAMYHLAWLLRRDDKLALKLLKEAADLGNMYAQAIVGYRYFYGTRYEKNEELGLRYIRTSARQGNGTALKRLGTIYSKGCKEVGIERDIFKAIFYFEKAIKSDSKGYGCTTISTQERARQKLIDLLEKHKLDHCKILYYKAKYGDNYGVSVKNTFRDSKYNHKDIFQSVYNVYKLDQSDEWPLSTTFVGIKRICEGTSVNYGFTLDDPCKMVLTHCDQLELGIKEMKDVLNNSDLHVKTLHEIIGRYITTILF